MKSTQDTGRAAKSFSVDAPRMIGRSGDGKPTLLRTISRLTPATGGEIRMDGRTVLELGAVAMCRWQPDCAMICQQFNLVSRLDAVTNVLPGG